MRKIQFDEETVSAIRSYINEGHSIRETCNRFTLKRDTLNRVMFENGIEPYFQEKCNNRIIVDEGLIQTVCSLYANTQMRMQDICKEVKLRDYVVQQILDEHFTEEFQNQRKAKMHSISKSGENNPLYGIKGENHSKYKGIISDGKGYLMVLKPEWYTGRKGSTHVFYHSVVMCEALGITEIPKGFVVHHIDGNPLNNDISNLCLLTNSAHSKLHTLYRKLCKVQRLSKDGVGKSE